MSPVESLRAAAISAIKSKPYRRPDIVIMRSLVDGSDTIREELKTIGDERRYPISLRVVEAQAKLIAGLARELLDRFERAGDEP